MLCFSRNSRPFDCPMRTSPAACFVGFVVALYLRVGRRTSLGNLLVASPLVFAATCVLFWALTHYARPSWLYSAFYVWVGMLGVLAPTQVWTLANYLLTTREAKRIFGMVGGGGILGWIFGGYLSKIVAKAFGTESLLLAMAGPSHHLFRPHGGRFQRRQASARIRRTIHSQASPEPVKKTCSSSILSVFSSRYLRAIAAVICISSFATTVTGWQFKAVAKQFSIGNRRIGDFLRRFLFLCRRPGLAVSVAAYHPPAAPLRYWPHALRPSRRDFGRLRRPAGLGNRRRCPVPQGWRSSPALFHQPIDHRIALFAAAQPGETRGQMVY